MTTQPATYLLKLRRNIALEGDLLLARLELEALLGAPLHPVDDLAALPTEFPDTPTQSLTLHARPEGVQAFRAEAPLDRLPGLIRRASFVQRIICAADSTPGAAEFVERVRRSHGPVIEVYQSGGRLTVEAVPHYALCELADVIARRAASVEAVRRDLPLLLDGLLNRTDDPRGAALAGRALAAQNTTSHLTHDLHYYKAKFFPRLVRALINVCAEESGASNHRLLDNFVGSGTALLEASLLGIPSVGLDLDPLSVLIARTKLAALRYDYRQVAAEAESALARLAEGHESDADAAAIRFPGWLLKNRKMTPEMAARLGEEIAALRAVVGAADPAVRDLFYVLLSDAITRRVRMRFLGTGVGRFSLTFSKTPLDGLFARSLRRYVKVIAAVDWLRGALRLDLAGAEVLSADTRAIPAGVGRFDLLVTSPPYLPASSGRESYARARAPSLIALGLASADELDALAGRSIGSMAGGEVEVDSLPPAAREAVGWLRGDALRAIKAAPTARYFLDMRQALAEMHRVLLPGARAVVVTGKQSTFYRFATREALYVVPAAAILAGEAERAGFEVIALHDIQLKKANMNARPRSLDDYYETLIMLRRPG
jgi:DNA modification methylase